MGDAYQQFIETLSRCKRVLVTTHVRPDGDALGTAAAMVLGLRKKNIDAEVLLLSPLPSKYGFVFADAAIGFYEMPEGGASAPGSRSEEAPAAAFRKPFDTLRRDDYDALLVVDTGTWSQLPGVRGLFDGWNRPKLVLDHHLTQEDWADVRLVVTEAAAAGEIAAELLSAWDIRFDQILADVLYVALVSDTGWFQYSNTRPYTLRLGATLMEAGARTDVIYQRLYQNERAERIALQTRIMDSLQLACDNRLAVLQVTRGDFERTGAEAADTQNAINLPLEIRTVQVSMLLVESPDAGPIRVSLRSKGQVDVARFAENFGGGGHARAAGLKVPGTLEEASRLLVERMRQALGAA